MKINVLVLLLLFTFAACQPTASTTPTLAPTTTPVPTSTQTPRPTPQPTITRAPTVTATQPLNVPVLSLENYSVFGSQNNLHNTIIFISAEYPFPGLRGGGGFDWQERYRLYAVAVDGSHYGILNSQESTFDVSLPADPAQPPRIAFSEFALNIQGYDVVKLPSECDLSPEQLSSNAAACNVELSPDGLYLGIRYGPDQCGRNMMIINVQTGQVIYRLDTNNGHWINFIGYDKALVARGHCEGGEISLLDLDSGVVRLLAPEGYMAMNASHTALFIIYGYYGSPDSSFILYNILTGKSYSPKASMRTLVSQPIWVADGQPIIYQFRQFEEDENFVPIFDHPARIMQMDSSTGQEQPLASASDRHFFLCDHMTAGCPPMQQGDWYSIKQVSTVDCPASASVWDYTAWGADYEGSVEEDCKQTITSAPLLALNARTGEILPWDDLPRPTLTPTAVPAGPDLSTKPIYQHPSGNYSFYTGPNGTGLWMVPRTGQVVQWVVDGWGLVLYLWFMKITGEKRVVEGFEKR